MFFNRKKSNQKNAARRKLRSRALRFESLEGRRVMAVNFLDITSITAVGDTDGNTTGSDIHATTTAGSSATVGFNFRVDAESGVVGNVALRDTNGQHIPVSQGSPNVTTAIVKNVLLSGSQSFTLPSNLPVGTYDVIFGLKQGGSVFTTDEANDPSQGITIVAGQVQITSTTTTIVSVAGASTSDGETFTLDYDGDTHAATATSTGGSTGVLSYTYAKAISPGVYGTPTENAPKDAGTYKIIATQAGDAIRSESSDEALLVINAKQISVSFTVTNKEYDGTNSATLSSGPTLNGVIAGDGVSISGGTATFADKNVGNAKVVTLLGATLAGTSAGNYVLAPATSSADITPLEITVTAIGQTKVYGEDDPQLTFAGSLLAGDSFTGSLTRVAGENAGYYPILPGTLSAGNNYLINYVGANLTITRASLCGDASTQDALNMAKAGKLSITVSGIGGFENGDNVDDFLSTAEYAIMIGSNKYWFAATSVIKLSNSSFLVTYSMKDPALLDSLNKALEEATSGAKAVTAGFYMQSLNYTLDDPYLTRMFSTIK